MRAIVAHLHAVSARLHFWMVDYPEGSSVCLPRPLVKLSALHDALHEDRLPFQAVPHPAQLLRPIAQRLELPLERLSVVSVLGWVEMPGEWTQVVLLRIEGNDLPALHGGRFITLMELLQVPITERLLLRKAYEALLGD